MPPVYQSIFTARFHISSIASTILLSKRKSLIHGGGTRNRTRVRFPKRIAIEPASVRVFGLLSFFRLDTTNTQFLQPFVFDHASISYEKLKLLRRHIDESKLINAPGGRRVPLFANPGCLKILVAGGPGKHSVYINSGHTKRVIIRKIAFPRNWTKLIEQFGE